MKNISLNSNIKSIALIDHWVNYKERFSVDSLPDSILVMDDFAYEIAVKEFNSKVDIIQSRNYFIEKILTDFCLIEDKMSSEVVFISEPTIRDKIDLNAYEYKAVEELLHNYDNLIIRLHPTENENKYNSVISRFPYVNVTIVKPYEEDLLVTLSKSQLTIGLGSMALYISYILGIKTVSYIFNSNIRPNIPIPKEYIIEDFKDLDKINFRSPYNNISNNNVTKFENIIQNILGND